VRYAGIIEAVFASEDDEDGDDDDDIAHVALAVVDFPLLLWSFLAVSAQDEGTLHH
jgi:hypothetical protein